MVDAADRDRRVEDEDLILDALSEPGAIEMWANIVEAAVEQEECRKTLQRVAHLENIVDGGVISTNGPMASHHRVQLSRATDKLKRAVREYRPDLRENNGR